MWFSGFCILTFNIALTEANELLCGETLCISTTDENPYCCGFYRQNCCYARSFWSLWYFWAGTGVFIILLSLFLVFCHRRRNRDEEEEFLIEQPHPDIPFSSQRINIPSAPPSYQQVQQQDLINKRYDIPAPPYEEVQSSNN